MFKSSEKNINDKEVETIIGASIKVKGDFIGKGNIIIEGTVTGSLKTERNLKIGEQAKIFASIVAANALIAGEVNGNITAKESLELTPTARVKGDIKAKNISIAPGALFNGKCDMLAEDVEAGKLKIANNKDKKNDLKS